MKTSIKILWLDLYLHKMTTGYKYNKQEKRYVSVLPRPMRQAYWY